MKRTASGQAPEFLQRRRFRQFLTQHGDDFIHALGGDTLLALAEQLLLARRDEEKSRAKERIFSHRNAQHAWDPKNQRPELWRIFNTRLAPGESMSASVEMTVSSI